MNNGNERLTAKRHHAMHFMHDTLSLAVLPIAEPQDDFSFTS